MALICNFWRVRLQLALVTAVVLVLMLGAATTVRDKVFPKPPVSTEQADVGAPAVTGALLVYILSPL